MARKKAVYTESHRAHTATRAKANKKVRDVMTPRVVAVTSVTFLPEAAQIMREEDVGALPVVQEDGKLMGIVTDRDITVRGVAGGGDLLHTQIGEIYTAEDLVTVTPETDLDEAEALMAEHQVRRLPIVERDNKLVGMIAMADIVRQDTKRDSGEVLRQVSKPGGEHVQGQ
ncbi:MAG TPA: CBS domain-containing protein [Oscillatoriaceae cyanobacterium]